MDDPERVKRIESMKAEYNAVCKRLIEAPLLEKAALIDEARRLSDAMLAFAGEKYGTSGRKPNQP